MTDFIKNLYHFFSFFPVKRATNEIPLTATTLKRMPEISPFDLHFLPKPATHEDFVVFCQIVEASIPWYKSCNLLTVLLKHDSDTLSDSGVWLF